MTKQIPFTYVLRLRFRQRRKDTPLTKWVRMIIKENFSLSSITTTQIRGCTIKLSHSESPFSRAWPSKSSGSLKLPEAHFTFKKGEIVRIEVVSTGHKRNALLLSLYGTHIVENTMRKRGKRQ